MATQQELIRRFETAPLPELQRIIYRPSQDEAAALKVWLGPDRYERLRKVALEPKTRGPSQKRKNVVVLHGIMGAELTVRKGKDEDVIWVNLLRVGAGRIRELRMKSDGSPEVDSYASDMMRKYYIEMLVGLGQEHNVQPFWFDWRRDLAESADQLQKSLTYWFGASSEVDFVAHSMGGLVVRTWIKRHKPRWDKGCRLVMLGTPNHGSFAIPQVITGAHKMVRKLETLDVRHDLGEFTRILNTFPGSLQMLPSPRVMPEMAPLYDAATWQGRGVSQSLLDRARKHHDSLAEVVDRERMAYIAGVGHLTAFGVRDWSGMDRLDGYTFTPEGDETVPHKLGFLNDDGGRVPVHFTRASHGELPNDPEVVTAVRQYLDSGEIKVLPASINAARGGVSGLPRGSGAARVLQEEWDQEVHQFTSTVQTARSRGSSADDRRERALEASVLSGFLDDNASMPAITSRGGNREASDEEDVESEKRSKPDPAGQVIEVAIQLGFIETFVDKKKSGAAPVDFLAAGHYQGVEPQYAEKALDIRLSRAVGLVDAATPDDEIDPDDLFITQGTRRGAVTMRLGEPYILPIPGSGLRIALAGLGPPGTFGRAELLLMVQEFTTTLAQLGCKHLGTVLIGSGTENMDIPTASRIWLETLHRLATSGLRVIPRITFVQNSAARAAEMDKAFKQVLERHKETWQGSIRYLGSPPSAAALASEKAKNEAPKGNPPPPNAEGPPTFINVSKIRDGYEFAAITNEASVPQRIIKVDPALVESVCRRLARNGVMKEQREWGTLLERLLIPRDLRTKLFSSASPVVFTVDASAARIPWEMLRVPSVLPEQQESSPVTSPQRLERHLDGFLGSKQGFGVTRQLRTVFAPAPALARGKNRNLKFLIVADPAEDASLPGAQEEAEAVAGIAAEFRERYRESTGGRYDVEIVKRIGPSEASREEVLCLLTSQAFDVLHFAGHCYFDEKNPVESGWIFHAERNERLTAAELSRLDYVPPFVFSNACESGITPDRVDERMLGIAPAFAESFFERGVRNFVCTAWPVDDLAALEFAREFYLSFLGLREKTGLNPSTIRDAMLDARRITAAAGTGGMETWGAYQHYGNPSFRFLKPATH